MNSLRSIFRCARTGLFLIALGCTPVTVVHGQAGKPQHATAVVLVDTDDSFRLTVDAQDEGIIMPSQSQKIAVPLGDHIVKCIVEDVPDVVRRKAVEAKSSEQAVAIVALKALHIQYHQQAQPQPQQAAPPEENARAAEENQRTQQNELLETRNSLMGTWQNVVQKQLPALSGCRETGWIRHTTILRVYSSNEPTSDVLAAQQQSKSHFHDVRRKTCKVSDNEPDDWFDQGNIQLTSDQPSVIDLADEDIDDDGQRLGTFSHYIGEITFINGNKISIDWKQGMSEKAEYDRVN